MTKLDHMGALSYSTFLGGSSSISWAIEQGNSIAVDAMGSAYVTGITSSPNFPVTPGAFMMTKAIDVYPAVYDAFVAKLKPDGSGFAYSTFLGGKGEDRGNAIAVDVDHNAWVAGWTSSDTTFPMVNASRATFIGPGGGFFGDGFVTKLNPDGSGLLYSTYIGDWEDNEADGIAVDETGNAYVTGHGRDLSNFADVFVKKIKADGSALLYSVQLSGSGWDAARDIAVDVGGNAHIAGFTSSTDFPVLNALQSANASLRAGELGDDVSDAFVTKLVMRVI